MDSLVPLYKAMAPTETGNFLGLSVLNHAKEIGRLIEEVDAKTVLDFGCGRGDAYRSPHKIHHQWGLPRAAVYLYDPAFHHAPMPTGKFDLVVCSDVLEHVPESEVDEFIARLFGFAKKAVWASFCARPAKKVFPGTGTNLHVTQRPYAWWWEKFEIAGHVEFMTRGADLMKRLVETP